MHSPTFDLLAGNAILTGASLGIGRTIAGALAGCGANALISSRSVKACQSVAMAANIANKSSLVENIDRSRALLGPDSFVRFYTPTQS